MEMGPGGPAAREHTQKGGQFELYPASGHGDGTPGRRPKALRRKEERRRRRGGLGLAPEKQSGVAELAPGALDAHLALDRREARIAREHRLESQLRYLLANPACNAVGSAINYLEGAIVTRSEDYPARAFREHQFSGCCATFMLRKSAADRVGGFNPELTKASEDVDFLARIEPIGSVHNIGEILYFYRRHGRQLTERADWVDAQAYYFMTEMLAEHGIMVTTDLADGLPPHELDEAQIEQVCLALFTNAIEAMPGGGGPNAAPA